MPKRAYALIGALIAFAVVVLGVVAWAQLSGTAGSQRGLVIHSTLQQDVLVTFEAGQTGIVGPSQRERTFVVKREQFPSTVRVTTPDGEPLFERRFAYQDFVDAEFRLSIDAQGFYPTSETRDTPEPTP